jgi:hypothetical protein
MLMRIFLLLAIAATTTPRHVYRECRIIMPEQQQTIVRLHAQDERLPFEGTRRWVEHEGRFYRIDSYGFETNCGPIYQSPQGNQVIVFSTFRNTVDGGLKFDLTTGQVTWIRGGPETFEADGWKALDWHDVEDAN